MSLTDYQGEMVVVASRIASAIGLLGALLTIPMFATGQIRISTPLGKLTFILWLADLQDSFFRLISNTSLLPIQTNEALCYFQAIMGSFATNCSVTGNAVVAFWAFYLFYIGGRNEILIKNQTAMIIAIYVFASFMAIFPLFLGQHIYTGTIWCALKPEYTIYQFYTSLLWIWVVSAFNLISLGFTWYHIQKRRLGSLIIVRLFSYLIVYVIVWAPAVSFRISLYFSTTAPLALSALYYTAIPIRGMLHYICLVIGQQIKFSNSTTEMVGPSGLATTEEQDQFCNSFQVETKDADILGEV
ncbi:hypothetical protein HDV06_001181 [Boothiomyces sp. JEL0866]|nr:hypothetical protein HDV06_001181 [Boothiomyces sp. JEL0866]